MSKLIVGFVAGAVFACGLVVSQMTMPGRIIGFLDFGGAWDPTLLFVMAGAIAVYLPIWWLRRGRKAPVGGKTIPTRLEGAIDKRLLLGATTFGIGWGICGICPGPGITLLGRPSPTALVFVLAMLGGMLLSGVLAPPGDG